MRKSSHFNSPLNVEISVINLCFLFSFQLQSKLDLNKGQIIKVP